MKKITKNISKSIYLKTYILGIFFSFMFASPVVFAATYSQDLFGLFELAKDVVDDLIIWLITTGAVIFFMWGLLKMLWKLLQGKTIDDNDKKNLFWGIVALTLMFTFYAVAGLIAVTFGIQLSIPQFFGSQDGLSPGSGRVINSRGIIDY